LAQNNDVALPDFSLYRNEQGAYSPLGVGGDLMKFFLLAGVAAATLMAQAAEAVTFSYTGSIVQWVVPTTGNFRIVASGAQGGQDSYLTTQAVGAYRWQVPLR
jgi:hypothetical protein